MANYGWADPETGERLKIGESGGILAELEKDGKWATQRGLASAERKVVKDFQQRVGAPGSGDAELRRSDDALQHATPGGHYTNPEGTTYSFGGSGGGSETPTPSAPLVTKNAVDVALNTKPSVDQLLNTPAPAAGKSKYDTAMDQLDGILKGVIHGDTQPQGGGQVPITSLDLMAAHNSAQPGHASPDAAEHLFATQQAYFSPENQSTLAKLGGESAYLTRIANTANYPQAPDTYQIDPRTSNYDTNVPGGSIQDAISKIGNPGMDYNASTGEWIPSNTPSVINGKAIPVSPPGPSTINGKPSAQAIDESYSRNVAAGVHADFRDQSAPIKISNPAPNGVEWPELPSSAFNFGLNEKKDKDQLRFY